MAHCNENYLNLQGAYLFATVRQKQNAYVEAHPDADIISLGIGDVTQPLAPAVIEAMHKAVDEMAHMETFRGYGPEQGYLFLREAIAQHDFKARGCDISPDEIFVSDGAKCDTGNMQEIFAESDIVAVTDPVYPVYVDSNVMAGRSGKFVNGSYERLEYLPCYEECGFKANLPSHDPMIIYLCSPNNPTGGVYNREQLKEWVDYANEQDAILLFDAAYESFVADPALPRSIFEIEGAKTCAIEFCSLSKLASFTGTRCGYTVVPSELERGGSSIRKMWLRRQTTKFNGVSYPVQRAAEAALSPEGMAQCREHLDVYRTNAKIMTETLKELGIWHIGGENSPYIWMQCPNGMKSWEFFDDLLAKANVVGTPGSGFGKNGEGFFRLTAFGTTANTKEAMERIKKVYGK